MCGNQNYGCGLWVSAGTESSLRERLNLLEVVVGECGDQMKYVEVDGKKNESNPQVVYDRLTKERSLWWAKPDSA